MINRKALIAASVVTLFLFSNCSKSSGGGSTTPIIDTTVISPPPAATTNDIDFWLTKPDKTALLQKQTGILGFVATGNTYPDLEVDSTIAFQTIDGFGYTLTGGSA